MPHATWERTRQVNLDGTFYIVQGMNITLSIYSSFHLNQHSHALAAANQMKSQIPQGGSIVSISSISALVGGEMQWFAISTMRIFYILNLSFSHYTPTKAGILSLMQSCAVALGKYNIRCNAILPGTIATDINTGSLCYPWISELPS